MSLDAIKLSNVYANNLGDGKTIRLSWSVADVNQVKYFVVEIWDRHKKRWIPYDGFHGLVSAQHNPYEYNPPQRLDIIIDDPGYNVSLRVKAIGHDGSESDWSSCSVKVEITGEDLPETGVYFVKDGLEVYRAQGYTIGVRPGTAYLGGCRRYVSEDVLLNLPSVNNTAYVVYISADGIVGYAAGDATPGESIRLADVVVDANGSISITDKRFLWSPSGLAVVAISGAAQNAYRLTWNGYDELNLRHWKIYRATGPAPSDADFVPWDSIDKYVTVYDDTTHITEGTKYWYKIAAVDWGNHESPRSAAVTAPVEGVPGAPSVPTGLVVVASGGMDGVHIDLSWNPNQEADLRGYKIWLRNSDDTYSLLDIVGKETTSWRHSWLVLGQVYTYALSAYDDQNLESLRCDPVSCQAGDTLAPAQPQWDSVDPIATGASGPGDYSCWVRLDWEPVIANADGSTITDLAGYYVYRVMDEGLMLVGSVSGDTTEYVARDLSRGLTVAYVIKAVDKWGNQSSPSVQQSITAGGLAPAAPVLVSLEALTDDTNRVRVTFERVTTNIDGTPCGDIAGYTIYRGISQSILAPIATIQAQDPQPGEYEFIDSGVQIGRTYYYAVTATDADYNESARSNILSVTAGDFEAPDAPTWVSLTTRVNADGTVDNILEWSHGNEDDLRGVYVYAATAPGDFELIAFAPKDVTTYTHVDLVNRQRYYYVLESFDKSGNRAKSAVRDIVAGSSIAPAAPVVSGEGIFNAETRIAGVRLTWPGVTQNTDGTSVTLLAGYRVYRAIVAAGEYSLIHTIECSDPGLAQSYDDWGLVNGNNYYYKVAAYNKLGNQGPYSSAVDVLAGDVTPPEAPTVTVEAIYNPSSPNVVGIKLTITSEDNPDHYNVYLSSDGLKWAFAGTTDNTYTYEIAYGSTTWYKVTATSISGVEGTPTSGSYTAIHDEAPTNIAAPTVTFVQRPDGLFDANVAWAYTPPDDFLRYEVWLNQANPIQVASIDDKYSKSCSLYGFAAGTQYTFAVTCKDVWGLSSVAQWRTAAPSDTTVPAAPSSITATPAALCVQVEWARTILNEDGSNCIDLDYYVLEISELPSFGVIAKTVHTQATSYTHQCGFDGKTYYYRVKAVDFYDNTSTGWTTTTAGVSALSAGESDVTPPSDVTWPSPYTEGVDWSTGVDWSSQDESENIWIELSWNPVADEDLDHYNIYMSSEHSETEPADDTFFEIARSKSIRTRINGLIASTRYWFKVTAQDKANNESQSRSAGKCLVSAYNERTLPAPTGLNVVVSKITLAVYWDPLTIDVNGVPVELKNIQYILESRSTTDLRDAPVRTWTPWTEIYRGESLYKIHTPVEAIRFYQYRVKAIDMAGNESSWGYNVNPDLDWQPDLMGSTDIAAGAIYGSHIRAEEIEGLHIKGGTITGGHIAGGTIQGTHIASGQIQTRHLDVTLGGYNYVLNSAFGMTDLAGNLGVSWTFTNCTPAIITDSLSSEIPINSKYCLHLSRVSEDPAKYVTSETSLPVASLAGKKVTVSYYKKHQNLNGTGCKVVLEITVGSATPALLTLGPFDFTGTSPWGRGSFVTTIPSDAMDIRLKIIMPTTCVGDLWITGLQVEVGDIITPWNPNPNELYGCSGLVQINSSGIRIVGGKLRVEANNSRVVIDDSGIVAIKTESAGQPISYARLNNQGLTIVNGAFSISTGDGTTASRVDITGAGISARKSGVVTFNLGSDGNLNMFDASLKFHSTDAGTARLEIDSFGIKAYNQVLQTLNIDATTGSVILRGGNFIISTSSVENDSSGVKINQQGISAYNAQAKTTFRLDSATGNTTIYGGSFTISTGFADTTTARLVMNGAGLTLYDDVGVVAQLSKDLIAGEGVRFLLKGGFKIKSTSTTNQILIDETGIYGPGFSLTQGYGTTPAGLTITNGVIQCGNVLINSSGLTVSGASGIFITTRGSSPTTLVSMTNEGLKVLGGLGLKVTGSGTIGIDPNNNGDYTVAIDSTGIKANAITAGVLTICGEEGVDSNPRIVIKNGPGTGAATLAVLDKYGLKIYGGALSVFSDSGSHVLVQNGMVSADALAIGMAGTNYVRNGRADFYNADFSIPAPPNGYWSTGGTAAVTSDDTIGEAGNIRAGISGSRAFRLSAPAVGDKFYQVCTDLVAGHTYTIACWVYVVSGTVRMQAVNATLDSGVTPPTASATSSFQQMKLTFRVPTPAPSSIDFTFDARATNTVAYITDICCVEGRIDSAFVPHATEIVGGKGNVRIDDTGIKITNGKLTLQTANSTLTINDTGIHHNQFELVETGLVLNFPTSKLTIDDTNGLLFRQNDSAYVKLHASTGLQIKGGLIDISTGQGGSVLINNTGIKATVDSSSYVELNGSTGLVVRGGAIDIESASTGARLKLVADQLSVYDGINLTPSIQLGRATYTDLNGQVRNIYGLVVNNGAMYMQASKSIDANITNSITIDPAVPVIQVSSDENGVIRSSVLKHDRLWFIGPTGELDYLHQIEAIPIMQSNNQWTDPYYYSTPFPDAPNIVVAPLSFQTYAANTSGNNQGVMIDVEHIRDASTGFYIGVRLRAARMVDSVREPIDSSSGSYSVPFTREFTTKVNGAARNTAKISGSLKTTSGGVWFTGGLCIQTSVYIRKENPAGAWVLVARHRVGGGNWGAVSGTLNYTYYAPESTVYRIKIESVALYGNGYGGVSVNTHYCYTDSIEGFSNWPLTLQGIAFI